MTTAANAAPLRYALDYVYPAPQSGNGVWSFTWYRQRREAHVPRPSDLIIEGWTSTEHETAATSGVIVVDGAAAGRIQFASKGSREHRFFAKVYTADLSFGTHEVKLRFSAAGGTVETTSILFEVHPSIGMPTGDPARILMAYAPKVGGTYQQAVLNKYMGIKNRPYNYEWRWESLLDAKEMVHPGYAGSYITGGHMLPRELNLEIIRRENLRTVGGWRNIADAIVSLDDHFHRETHLWPWTYVGQPERYFALSDQRRYRFLIRQAVPWFIDYYVSWLDVGVPLFARYEWMASDPKAFFNHFMRCLFGEVDEARLDGILASRPDNVRFNRGVSGRANELFSAETKSLLEETLRDYYRPVDDLIAELPWNEGASASIALALDRQKFELEVRKRPFFAPIRYTSFAEHPAIADATSLVAWGAGAAAEELFSRHLDPASLRFFVDADPAKTGTTLFGVAVRPPEALGREVGHTVIVTSLDHEEAIKSTIQGQFAAQVREIVSASELLEAVKL